MSRAQDDAAAAVAAAPPQAHRIEEQLDAALEDSFPASDPVSFVTSQTEEYWRPEDTPSGKASDRTDGAGT
jgi:hypothetical protein